MSKAEAHIGLGDYVDAINEYRSIADSYKNDPKRAIALFRIADIYATSLNNTEAALKTYEEVIDDSPFSYAARESRERRAALLERIGDYEGAIEDYFSLLKYFGDNVQGMRYRILTAGAYLSMKDYRQARTEIKPIVEDTNAPKDILEQAIFLAAESYFLEGMTRKAAGYYIWFLEEFPESKLASEAKLHLANCYEELGYLGVASNITKSAAKDYPNKKVVDARLESLKARGKVAEDVKKDVYKRGSLR